MRYTAEIYYTIEGGVCKSLSFTSTYGCGIGSMPALFLQQGSLCILIVAAICDLVASIGQRNIFIISASIYMQGIAAPLFNLYCTTISQNVKLLFCIYILNNILSLFMKYLQYLYLIYF